MSHRPEMALVDGASFPSDSEAWEWLSLTNGDGLVPLVVIVPEDSLSEWVGCVAEDFIVEPYRKSELLFRVRRLARRTAPQGAGETIRRGDLVIDDSSYEVKVGERKIDLTFREYQLLKYLALHPGRVLTRETLLDRVWGYDYYGGDRTVDVHVRRLRSKLEDSEHIFVDTVRNVGYRFRG